MKIDLVPHDPRWSSVFDGLRDRLVGAIGSKALDVLHVGSTAIPGIRAKPIVDVTLVVSDSSDEAGYVGDVEAAGFVLHARESDWHEHRLLKFVEPAANVHVFSEGCVEIARLVSFRDLLRRDAAARETYERRKLLLASREWSRGQEYADAKADTVESLLGAIAWEWQRPCSSS